MLLCGLLWVVLVPIHRADASEFGVYEGAGCSAVNQVSTFARWAGHLPDRVVDFVAFSSWRDMEGAGSWGIRCWADHGHPALTLTLPLTVEGTDLAEVAAGKGDEAYAKLGRTLVQSGYGDAVVRLGHEMNANWYPWGRLGDRDPERQRQRIATYKAAFRHVVGVLRGIAGARFQIDWCPAAGKQQVAQADLYPGDDVVDIVGTDVYPLVWGVNHPSEAQIMAFLHQGWQLDAVSDFGKEHGKPISFPEWGVGSAPFGSSDYGPGDSPRVMAFMVGWFAAHTSRRGQSPQPGQIAYTSYWDFDAGYDSRVSSGERPNEGAVLRRAIEDGSLTGH